ncbi:hypothetical protein CDD81_7719 [Ophiocordyceps australis]|uniref:Uncharacterized protein n=1 Tax=Ophiocordyceps australis TaxID=1399860 RepID=A0A2C5Y4N4_9HYPO|nr:hypothetical protein CDD81_7719 [Ophiocordyceps australis]
MAPDRIANAIDSLIAHLVPSSPDDDAEAAQARHNDCVQLVRSIIDSPAHPAISPDVNHASDLIKRKLVQNKPGQALHYSNLYTQLLCLPVLQHKWAILYLLYQLADSPDPDEPIPPSPIKPSAPNYREAIKRHSRQRFKPVSDEEEFKAAFQPDGLRMLPAEQKRDSLQQPQDGARRTGAPTPTRVGNAYTQLVPSETTLLRSLPFTLQGISSASLPFTDSDSLKLPPTLPLPLIGILHTLAEPSLLYRNLDAFCQTQPQGLLGQSLRSALSNELRSYLSLIATIESQMRGALAGVDQEAAGGNSMAKAGITLKSCVVWTGDATLGLRLMSHIAEESKSRKGGQLISLIHGFLSYGDALVAGFAEQLLSSFTKPFYDMLRHWIYDGELLDPYVEFFVREQTHRGGEEEAKGKKKGSGNLWEDKYEIDESMVPSIMTRDFAQKVFLIGKSLNFIRHSCGDSAWVEQYSRAASKELRYGDTATLEGWIDEAYKTTMKRLMELMADKFNLFDHLQALKSYILLGQGDFITLLMESLAGNLDGPAGAQYRHTLTAQLEHAIRGSSAQYDSPEVLRRLDARMLQLSHGDIGWDCFTLEYKIDTPVDVVVTEWGNRQYLKVFNFLWRIKRVEFALLTTWRKCMTGSRGVLQSPDGQVMTTWETTRGVLAEMKHFVGQLQNYIEFEVIKPSWEELQQRIGKDDCTLDDLINAHGRYLDDITHKGLLGAKQRRPQQQQQQQQQQPGGAAAGPAEGEDDRTSYLAQLSDILRFMLNYREAVDGLYSWSVADFTRRQGADVRGAMGGWRESVDDGGALGDMGEAGVSEFPALHERLRQLGASFRTRVQILLGDLAYQPDVDMRFLGVAMNYNDVYQPARRKSKTTTTTKA